METEACCGDVAQMVERSLSMREVRGSIPRISIFICLIFERGSVIQLNESRLITNIIFLLSKRINSLLARAQVG